MSLFSILNMSGSALQAQQVGLQVTANNIANANTTGFKSSTTVFQDTLSQMMNGGTAANAERGGTNPVQIGLGVQIATTSTNFNQGSAQMTGRGTDLMLQGDGFFVVQRGNVTRKHQAPDLLLFGNRCAGEVQPENSKEAEQEMQVVSIELGLAGQPVDRHWQAIKKQQCGCWL